MISISDYDPFGYRLVGEIPIYVGIYKTSLCLGVEIIDAIIDLYRVTELPLDSHGINSRFIEGSRFEGHSMTRLSLYLECYEYVHSKKCVFLDKVAQQCIDIVRDIMSTLEFDDTDLKSAIENTIIPYEIILDAFNSGTVDIKWIIDDINDYLISLDKKSNSTL